MWLGVCGLRASEHHGVVKFGAVPVPGATVTAAQGDRKFVAVTDAQGFYSFSDLPDGVWTVEVEMLCFEPLKREIGVGPNAPAAEWELKLLPMEQIQAAAPPLSAAPPPAPVTASAPAETPKRGTKTKAKASSNPAAMPQAGFQRAEVNASSSGARFEGDNADNNADQSQNATDGFLINGSVNNGAASPFAQSGAFGNNRRMLFRPMYTGGVGFTLGNSALDARSFSLTGQEVPRPDYSHFQGMASFGGPLRIKALGKQSSPNFVINYQWTRNRTATTQPAFMPGAAERGGDFSQSPTPVVDPSTGSPFPGNIIPAGRISPQAKALLDLYPLPNFTETARYNYQTLLLGVTHQDNVQARLGKLLNRNNQLNGTFAWQSQRSDNPSLFGFLDTAGTSGLNTGISWFHRLAQRSALTLGYQFSRLAVRTTPYFAGLRNVSGDAGITGNNQESANWGPPNLSFASGIAGLSDPQNAYTRNQTSSLTASLFWSHREHNVTAGAEFRRQQFNLLSQQDARGTFAFTGAAAGSDFAGFLLGIPDTASIAFGNADKYLRASGYSLYFTDDWRIGSGITVNAGVRWEYGSPITERYGRLVNLDIGAGFAAEAPVLATSPTGPLTGRTYPASLIRPDRHAVQPRIGIAWRPLLASSLVIRAGYGVYYDTSVYLPIATQMAQQSPLSKSLSVPNSALNPLTLANGFRAAPGVTPNTFAVDPDFLAGYAQNWNLSVQRDLPFAMVIVANYLGTKGTRSQQQFLPNTVPAGALNPCPACPLGYAYLTSNGNSSRHAGQVQLRRRLHNGLTSSIQYTYAKSIDDAALGGKNQGGAVIAQNWLDLAAERGLSNFDQRHVVNFLVQYSTGMGLGGGTLLGGWCGGLFKDWTIATQVNAATGLPLTPIYLAAVAGTGVTGSIRPDYTGAAIDNPPAGLYLNPAGGGETRARAMGQRR